MLQGAHECCDAKNKMLKIGMVFSQESLKIFCTAMEISHYGIEYRYLKN
jgi:hypothetical protein